jgi:uncharacterized protein YvpB
MLEQSGQVGLMGRVGTQQGFGPANINAYYLRVSDSGTWSILKNTSGGTETTLKTGTVAALGLNTWHNLALSFQGSTITAQIDNVTAGSVNDTSYSAGQVGYDLAGWQNAQFDNFSVTPGQSPYAGTYYELVSRSSGKVIDVAQSTTTSGAPIIQDTDQLASSQQWQILSTNNGYAKLVNRNSGLVLGVTNGSTANGAPLSQANNDTGRDSQQWQLMDTGNGYYTLTNRNSGLLADVDGASTQDGTPIVQRPASNEAHQQWELVPVPVPGATYEFVNRNSGKVIDVSGESKADGGVIIQYTDHGGANQQWQLVDDGNGYYSLINRNSGKALDVPNWSTTTGVQLDQWASNGGANQQWKFVADGSGYYTLVNKNSGLAVDVAGSSTNDVASVIQATASSSSTSQQWQLVPVS